MTDETPQPGENDTIPGWLRHANLAITATADCLGYAEAAGDGPFGWCIYDQDEDDPPLIEIPCGEREDAEFVLAAVRDHAVVVEERDTLQAEKDLLSSAVLWMSRFAHTDGGWAPTMLRAYDIAAKHRDAKTARAALGNTP